jgi:GNAT superfamily N-acetyltransferase
MGLLRGFGSGVVVENEILCWEALDPQDPALERVRHLYETTQAASERIPWRWIEGAVAERTSWRPRHWAPHLLLAAPRSRKGNPEPVVGFAYGIHVPGYGGYATYLGVEAKHRGKGIGGRLLGLLTRVLQVDAAGEGVPLPFVVWESHRPEPGDPPEAWALWQARQRLFTRAGAWWIAGLTLLAPNYAQRGGPPVPLQLYLIPVDVLAEAFGPAALREVAAGLLRGVYGIEEGDPLFEGTLPADCQPVLRPPADAARR